MILDNFVQWLVVNRLFLEMILLDNQKDGSEETRELDLYWKSQPVFHHFKYGIEIRIESVNKDSSHSWVRISYVTVKYVFDSIEDDTENPADPQEEQVPQTSIKVVAARSKATAKPQHREPVGTTATIPMNQWSSSRSRFIHPQWKE